MGNDPESEAEPPRQDAQNSRLSHRRVGSDETERPHSAQQTQHDTDSHISETSEEEESDEDDSDPAHRIGDFDWEDLHHRYHEAMKVCHGEEAALMEEWESLMTVICAAPQNRRKMLMLFCLVLPHMGAVRT